MFLSLVIIVQLLAVVMLLLAVKQLPGVRCWIDVSVSQLLNQISPSGNYGVRLAIIESQLAGVSLQCNKPLPWGLWLIALLMAILPKHLTQTRLGLQGLALLKPLAPVLVKKIYR
jgi:hypothetical protein